MNTKNTGLILSELVIVIIIIGIVISAVFLTYRNSEETQLRSSLAALMSDLRYAQRLAITENTETEVMFSVINNRYLIRKMQPSGLVTTIRTVELDSVTLKSVNAPGASNPLVANRVVYTPRGTTGSACTITIDTNGYTGSLTVNVGSGRVKITEIKPK